MSFCTIICRDFVVLRCVALWTFAAVSCGILPFNSAWNCGIEAALVEQSFWAFNNRLISVEAICWKRDRQWIADSRGRNWTNWMSSPRSQKLIDLMRIAIGPSNGILADSGSVIEQSRFNVDAAILSRPSLILRSLFRSRFDACENPEISTHPPHELLRPP